MFPEKSIRRKIMKIAIMGCGTVGGGVYNLSVASQEQLKRKCGEAVEVKYILDLREFKGEPFEKLIVHDIGTIVNDPEVGVVVETMGGVEPAFTFCMKCLNAGKAVVTSNKQLVATKGIELFAAAKKNNAAFRFEASVCGGIPVINTLCSDLGANNTLKMAGILNGTTNFILAKMLDDSMSFDDALSLAQANGYAERDPSADIEGTDSCRKICILASLAFGTHISPEGLYCKGITGIVPSDFTAAEKLGYSIKLLGVAEAAGDGKLYAFVSPMLVSHKNMLSGVNGVFNALSYTGDSIGEVILYGQGAGREATASAVMGDVLECVRAHGFSAHYSWEPAEEDRVLPFENRKSRLFVRDGEKAYITEETTPAEFTAPEGATVIPVLE